MATSRKAPGTYVENGVHCTMGAPFSKATSPRATGPGIDGRNNAPFNKPQDMGNGGIPTRFYDEGMKAGMPKTSTAGQVSPPIGATQSVGTRRFTNPK